MTAPRPRPARITGLAHVFAAFRYSLAGLRRLWQEAAFRHEVLVACAVALVLAVLGASVGQLAIFAVLALLTVAVEALNTAIEVVVDHLSPEWSEFARDAKDLGSLAVMCLLLATGVYVASVLFGLLI
jgi:diacylglycerol kinase (ATP)